MDDGRTVDRSKKTRNARRETAANHGSRVSGVSANASQSYVHTVCTLYLLYKNKARTTTSKRNIIKQTKSKTDKKDRQIERYCTYTLYCTYKLCMYDILYIPYCIYKRSCMSRRVEYLYSVLYLPVNCTCTCTSNSIQSNPIQSSPIQSDPTFWAVVGSKAPN